MCWLASKRAQGPGFPQPKEPKGPETVELRKYLKGSGMGLPPNISRTARLKKYCIYSMWFHEVEPSPIGGFEGERVFGSVQRAAQRNGKVCPLKERMLSTSWASELELHREGFFIQGLREILAAQGSP